MCDIPEVPSVCGTGDKISRTRKHNSPPKATLLVCHKVGYNPEFPVTNQVFESFSAVLRVRKLRRKTSARFPCDAIAFHSAENVGSQHRD